jgi:peroxiredoxin
MHTIPNERFQLARTSLFSVPLCVALLSAEVRAAELAADNFSAILKQHTAATFDAVAAYAGANPAAADIDAAHRWLLTTAIEQGLEARGLPVAERVLEQADADETLRRQALRVRGVGLARSGKLAEALGVLDEHLASASIRTPNDAVDFAFTMVAQAQLAGEFDAVREILDRLSTKFALNAQVRQLVEDRGARLALLGQPAPMLSVDDLEEKPVGLDEYRGKVLLVDFWATNCPPCLEGFPELKAVYLERHDDGFEIVGISLDEDVKTVKVFCEKRQLPWRMALALTDTEDTRERYHADTIPAMFLIDRNGRVAFVDLHGADLRLAVEKLLGASP